MGDDSRHELQVLAKHGEKTFLLRLRNRKPKIT